MITVVYTSLVISFQDTKNNIYEKSAHHGHGHGPRLFLSVKTSKVKDSRPQDQDNSTFIISPKSGLTKDKGNTVYDNTIYDFTIDDRR